ncbi:unnamed protein product [Rotaria sordida]|uniref:Chitin-binding type-1 domain-containing protein n=1 Tax=Rotaria sordida TaxID=392033 RepID=A0A813QET9_9BILA|nr:unnamed protein product [Rotaria sordida]
MQSHNLFSLLADRILLHPNSFTMVTYNVLFEIDTLSILHGRITKEDYYRKVNKIVESMKDDDDNESKTSISPRKLSDSQTPVDEQTASTPISNRQVFKTNQLSPFTISEFKYSPTYIRLLHSVFDSIEVDVRLWRSDSTRSITVVINNPDNQIFCANVVHIISQMADGLCNAYDSLETVLELTYLMNINENDDISTLIASFIKNLESVLQELDVQRLSAIFSRQASIISTTPKYSTWLVRSACPHPTHCRSKWGYCGTGSAYCGDGCQAGPCTGTSGNNNGGINGGGLACPHPTQCRSKWGYCGTGSDYCGNGCQAGPCTGANGNNNDNTRDSGSVGVIDSSTFACVFNTIDSALRTNRFNGLKATGWTPVNKDEAAVFLAHVFHETDGLKTMREYCAPGMLF